MAYPDFEEFIVELNAHGVRYLTILSRNSPWALAQLRCDPTR